MVRSVQCFVCGDSVDVAEAERFVLETGQASAKNLQSVQEFAHPTCEPRVPMSAVRIEGDAVVIHI